jgi:hypothetical protein
VIRRHDGVPVFCKWLTMHNGGTPTITVDRSSSEILAVALGGFPCAAGRTSRAYCSGAGAKSTRVLTEIGASGVAFAELKNMNMRLSLRFRIMEE